MKRTSAAIGFLALALGVFCGAGRSQQAAEAHTGTRSGFDFQRVPQDSLRRDNPFQGVPAAIRAGEKLFLQHCAECHSSTEEKTRGPHLNSGKVRKAPPGALFWFVRNGNLKRGMPAWSRLPDQRIWQIVGFLQAQAAPGEDTPR